MRTAIFDLETDGLLDVVTKVHVMVIKDLQTGETHRFNEEDMEAGLGKLARYDLIIGHNAIKFDIPVLTKLYGWTVPWTKVRDTINLARLVYPDVKAVDFDRIRRGVDFPKNLIGSHSLEAWGHRLGVHKGDFKGPWDVWTQEMEDYCVQDVGVTAELYTRLMAKAPTEESILLETQVAWIVARQERHGFLFDLDTAAKLYSTLVKRKLEMTDQLRTVFLPRYLPDGKEFAPKRDNKKMGYCAGAPFQKVDLTMFNPGSRPHIARWLKAMRGWEPTEYTDNGAPKVDEQVIGQLKYPEAKMLTEYLMVEKRIGQLAEGKEAWMKAVGPDGRIHGSVNTNGAVTGRMTHSHPNVSQVPAGYSKWGPECRSLFTVPAGKVLVGADAAALELRDLAGYMATYDGGDYIKTATEGRKEDGTDVHSVNAVALGLDPKAGGRDIAKTWFYAFLYGAGDAKLGSILTGKKTAVKAGRDSKARFMTNLPALGKLAKAVKAKAMAAKALRGLDGRIVPVRSDHAALNTLLQSAGGLQMKRALCLLDDDLQARGLVPGVNYEFVCNSHDEWQIEVDSGLDQLVGEAAVASIKRAGESFGFKCPLDGEWRSGTNWNQTH